MQGLRQFLKTLKNSAIITVAVSVIALIINIFHPHRIPLFASKPYEIYVPCPEKSGTISEITVEELPSILNKSVIIDARSREEFEKWHFAGAINIEYDYLTPICPKKIKWIISQKKQYVIVYGDGEEPDSGRELAKEISGNGVKNVFYIQNGIKGLKR
ncbi:MAG: rhodanese-like domain-containing protein [Deltaproteobacteria bacterium]|nr:rhodanese-like domain-containing protein [Deltaproteobacteria bacterium]